MMRSAHPVALRLPMLLSEPRDSEERVVLLLDHLGGDLLGGLAPGDRGVQFVFGAIALLGIDALDQPGVDQVEEGMYGESE